MAQPNAQLRKPSAGERKELEARHVCPACGHATADSRRTTVALVCAYKFPQEQMALEAVTCDSCGCVSFYHPSAVRDGSPPPVPS
jgi:hypothetical protein